MSSFNSPMAETESDSEAKKMLDACVFDYLLRNKLYETAKSFITEGKFATDPIASDVRQGYLFKWWFVHFNSLNANTKKEQSELAATYIQIQQMQVREQQFRALTPSTADINGELNLDLSMDSLVRQQTILHPKSELGCTGAGLNQGVPYLPPKPKRQPEIEIDQLQRSLGVQIQQLNMTTQNQFLLESKQHLISAEAQAHDNLRYSAYHGGIDPRRVFGLSHGSWGATDDWYTRNDGLMYSQVQPGSVKHEFQPIGDIATLDDNVKRLKRSPKGFTFVDTVAIRRRNSSKVTCCNFSSDGKFLASAGHDKKVIIWNIINLRTHSTPEEHKSVITDVCFRPNSTQLATASMDKSVRLWDAANPIRSLHEYSGHDSEVMSLDFHPKKTDLFCSCDGNDEIRYWNISQSSSCRRVFKGGNGLVRFQPRHGGVLAAVYNKAVSVFDVETSTHLYLLQGHPEAVDYICWDPSGAVLVSVSQCLVKIWSMVSGECIQELASAPDQLFYPCVFHPSYSTLLIIGGRKCLELWNMTHNKITTVSAHEDTVSSLAQSPVTRMVASASHDSLVKLWK